VGTISILAKNKFSSNVIEKCLRTVNKNLRDKLIDEVAKEEVLGELITHQYGNYVVQTSLQVCNDQQFEKFVDLVTPILYLIKSTPYYKKISILMSKRNVKI
jgi:hypothetical protein